MTPMRIDIPNRKPELVARLAADVVIARLRSLGICPKKSLGSSMMCDLVRAWSQGEMSDAQFDHCCRNVLILNPALCLESRSA